MANNTNGSIKNWSDFVHDVSVDSEEAERIRTFVLQDERPIEAVICEIIVDNASLKVKSVEYYNSYAISYAPDKKHPKMGGHTFWFYHTEPIAGIRALSYMLEFWPDYFEGLVESTQSKALF